MSKRTIQRSRKLTNGIYWVGKIGIGGRLDCNPYLIIEEDEAVLIDPGSVLDFTVVKKNIESLISLDKIKLIIVHHQDPDLCGSLPYFEQAGVKCPIALHWRTSTIVKYYGINNSFYNVNEENWSWKFSSGREIEFIPAPYCHFPGAILSYDKRSKILFSGDLFGSFHKRGESSFTIDNYIESMKTFHEHYMPSNKILKSVMLNLNKYDIKVIAPQHGKIITSNINRYISELSNLNCGTLLFNLPEGDENRITKATIISILTRLYKRLIAICPIDNINDILANSQFEFKNGELKIGNIEPKDSIEIFFKQFKGKKKEIINTITPLLLSQLEEYELPLPNFIRQAEHQIISSTTPDSKINTKIVTAEENILLDNLTGLHNQFFFQSYMEGVFSISQVPKDFGVLYIAIDNIVEINQKHGRDAGDEVLKSLAYLLEKLKPKDNNSQLFKLNNPIFILSYELIKPEELELKADEIIKEIRDSNYFIEKINISIALSFSGKWKENYTYSDFDKYNKAKLLVAKQRGINNICKEIDTDNPDEILQKRVLFIEPDDSYINLIISSLEDKGIHITRVDDGSMALERRSGWNPDLIVTEAMTPKVNGFQLKEKLNSLTGRNDTPFILISQRKDDEYIKRASELGIVHYLKKPFSLLELEGLIVNLLESK